MSKTTEYTAFGKTRTVPLRVFLRNEEIDSDWWEETYWIERDEEWYGLMSKGLRNKRVRVIEGRVWRRAGDGF